MNVVKYLIFFIFILIFALTKNIAFTCLSFKPSSLKNILRGKCLFKFYPKACHFILVISSEVMAFSL